MITRSIFRLLSREGCGRNFRVQVPNMLRSLNATSLIALGDYFESKLDSKNIGLLAAVALDEVFHIFAEDRVRQKAFPIPRSNLGPEEISEADEGIHRGFAPCSSKSHAKKPLAATPAVLPAAAGGFPAEEIEGCTLSVQVPLAYDQLQPRLGYFGVVNGNRYVHLQKLDAKITVEPSRDSTRISADVSDDALVVTAVVPFILLVERIARDAGCGAELATFVCVECCDHEGISLREAMMSALSVGGPRRTCSCGKLSFAIERVRSAMQHADAALPVTAEEVLETLPGPFVDGVLWTPLRTLLAMEKMDVIAWLRAFLIPLTDVTSALRTFRALDADASPISSHGSRATAAECVSAMTGDRLKRIEDAWASMPSDARAHDIGTQILALFRRREVTIGATDLR